MAGLAVILISILSAVFAYLIIPDKSSNANTMLLPTAIKKPGSSYTILLLKKNRSADDHSILHRMLFGDVNAYEELPVTAIRFSKDSVYAKPYIGDEETSAEEVFSDKLVITGNEDVPISSSVTHAINFIRQNQLIKKTYWLGSDIYGRDLLSRLILGGRISMAVGLVSVIISLVVGIFIGSVSGYFGGWIDVFLSWLMNVLWSLPALLLVIALSFALGKGFWQVFLAIGLSMWVDVARLVRGQIIALKQVEYIEAGRALGFTHTRIIARHMLLNLIGPILVLASGNFASAILLEAGLSFLGFGAQPPTPTWGNMIKEHYGYIVINGAYLAIFPGLAIMLLVYAFNLVTIGLRDAFDVRSQQIRE